MFNGSPLFTGDAGSGESEIRRWIIENDWLEAIRAARSTVLQHRHQYHIWIVTNKKPSARQGKIQLINATGLFEKMRKSLGNKRNYLTDAHIAEITRIYGNFEAGPYSKILTTTTSATADQGGAPAQAQLPGIARAYRTAARGEGVSEPR